MTSIYPTCVCLDNLGSNRVHETKDEVQFLYFISINLFLFIPQLILRLGELNILNKFQNHLMIYFLAHQLMLLMSKQEIPIPRIRLHIVINFSNSNSFFLIFYTIIEILLKMYTWQLGHLGHFFITNVTHYRFKYGIFNIFEKPWKTHTQF